MKLKLLAGAAIAAMTVATGAYAEQATGWYGAIDLGGNQKSEWKAKSAGNMVDGSPFVYNVSTSDDWAGFARLGYRYSPNWRVELEGGYRPGDVANAIGFKRNYGAVGLKDTALCTPSISLTGKPCGGPSGSFTQSSLMVNMIYDILPESTFHPFVGVGVGAVQSKVKMIGQYSVNPVATPEHLSIVGDDIAPAAQLLAGMAWALTDTTSIDLTYRYMEVGDTTIASKSSSAAAGWTPGDFKGGFNDQTLTVGLRMAFGAPVPPPPPPAPEPEPAPPPPPPPPPVVVEPVKPACDAREFIVYFEFDKSALTSDASAVVSAAADYSKTCGAARVVVVGHTDTSGSVAYNVKLSERRGKVVADALAGQGVNPNVLAVDWKGESAPAVATGDGVKEPLNRRSTIDISF